MTLAPLTQTNRVKQRNMFSGAIIGMGGLGCPALVTLLKSWPIDSELKLTIYDGDNVEISNLNRQILFTPSDIGKNKSMTAIKNLPLVLSAKIPTTINLSHVPSYVSRETIKHELKDADFIIDCTDSVSIKLVLNEYCVTHKKLLSYAGVLGKDGICFCIHPGGPCLSCLFGDFSTEDIVRIGGTCQEGGIIGASAALTAALQIENLFLRLFNSRSDPLLSGTYLYTIQSTSIKKTLIKADQHCSLKCTEHVRV
jgi:molybdopterin/thiamine biosynthesis adenylyltransferase